MIYTCFYIFATVVSYVITTAAYSQAGDMLLAVGSALGAIVILCKYLELNIIFPSQVEQVEMNQYNETNVRHFSFN
jgi:hypothetical protein